jgi:hypothetical protein
MGLTAGIFLASILLKEMRYLVYDCEAVENYLSITISKGKDFNVICKSCHRRISLALKITQQRKESLLKGRRAVHEKILENRSKRELPTDAVITA